MNIWGTHRVPEETQLAFSVGKLEIAVRRNGREWLFSHRLVDNDVTTEEPATGSASAAAPDGASPENTVPPQDTLSEPSRYVAADQSPLLTFLPVMPDRPVVARADTPFALGPGVEARFYAEIPVWIRAIVAEDPRRILFDVPTRRLSNTWFGGVVTGRLCYSLDRELLFHRQEIRHGDDVAVCALRYRNQSRAPFSSGKVAVFADCLRVYRGPDGLWTNDAVATILGPEQLNVSVAESLPMPEDSLQLLSDPRVPSNEGFVRKGLILLRTITNY